MIRSLVYSLAPPSGTLNRDLKLIFTSNFIGAIGDGLYAYILPIYIRGLQASSADVGFLFSIFLLTTALTIIPGGFLADRYDRKKVMILGWLLWVPVPLIFSMATHWTQLIPVMGLYGFFLSGPATGAYIVTAAKRDRVTLTYTLMSASWWTGYIFSPGLGGYLSTTIVGMRGVFLLAFTLYSAATIVLFFVHSQTARELPEEQQTNSKTHPTHAQKIVTLSVFFAFVFFFVNLVRPLVVQFFQDVYKLGNPMIGLLGSVAFLGSAVFSLLLGKIGDKMGKMIAVVIALLIGGLSFGLFICFSNPLTLGTASFLNGASYMLWSLMGASVGSLAPAASRGRWISLAQMSATLAAAVAPYLGGVLYEWSPVVPFYVIIAATPFLSLTALARPFKEKHLIIETSAQS
jgi:MFS family permease